jgi:hypothetical protein
MFVSFVEAANRTPKTEDASAPLQSVSNIITPPHELETVANVSPTTPDIQDTESEEETADVDLPELLYFFD